MATVVNRQAPYSGLANLMAMRGRMGDTELVHMSPSEIKGLASLGQLTINPDTGLPEAFKLKQLLPTIAGIAAGVATGGTSLLIPAIATGLTSAVVNKDIGRGLFDGLISYAGGSIMKGLSGAGGQSFGDLATKTAATTTTAVPAEAASQAAQQFTASQLGQVGSGATASALPAAGGMMGAIPVSTLSNASQLAQIGSLGSSGLGAAGGMMGPIPISTLSASQLGQVGTNAGIGLPAAGGMMAPIPASSGIASMVPGGVSQSVPIMTSPTVSYTAKQDIPPNFLGRMLGRETIKEGATLTPMQVAQLGGGTEGLSTGELARFYAPKAAIGVGGSMLQDAMTPEYPQPEVISKTVTPRTPRTLTRTALRDKPVTEEEALGAALGTGPALRFSDYTTRFANEGGLVGLATGGGIPPIEEAGYVSDPDAPENERGTGVIGGVDITAPTDIGLGSIKGPSPLSLGLGLAGLAMGVPGLGVLGSMIGAPEVDPTGQVQAYGYGNQSFDKFDNPINSPEYTANLLGYNPEVPSQSKIDFEYVNVPTSDFNYSPGLNVTDFANAHAGEVGDAGGVDSGSGDQGDTGVGHGAGEGTADAPSFRYGGFLAALAAGGRPYFEGMVPGNAHGMKDNVAFKVQGGNIDTAMLSPGEYVVPADVVSMLGNGNGDSGAKQLDAFAKDIRQKAFGTKKQQKQINAPKELGQLATA